MRKLRKNNKAQIDAGMIMGIVVALIILAVGVFAFFVTVQQISTTDFESTDDDATTQTLNNLSGVGNSVFNVIGVVLIIGVIMTIVGMVYSYIRPYDSSYDSTSTERREAEERAEREERERISIEQKRKEREQKRKAREKEREKKRKEKVRNRYYTKNRTSRMGKAAQILDEKKGKNIR